ncbi:MAG TPA: hypothetical protein VIS06_01560 [Mycobacteriales bacterium]
MIAAFGLGVRSLRTPGGAAVGLFAAVIALLVSTVLGMAAALPSALSAGSVRQNNRYPISDGAVLRPITGSALTVGQHDTLWHGRHIGIVEVVDGTGATPPPGVSALPGAGRSVVSPALLDLLRDDPTGLLTDRVPHPVGQIEPAGLANPAELFAYVGVSRTALGPDASQVIGWGPRGVSLFRSDISPYLALPIAVLVIAPMLALLTGLLRLDERRRTTRLSGLAVLGATRAQRLAADAGAVLLPLVAGWAAAWPLSGPFDTALAEHAMAGRLFFGTDLDPSVRVRLGVLALIMVVAGSLSLGETGSDMERIEGDRRYRIGVRAVVAAALVGVGTLAVAVTLLDGAGARRTATWIFGAAGLLVAGAAIGLPVLVLGLCRAFTGGGVAGELSRAHLAGTRSSWRSAALSLLLAGAVAGTALSVLTVLDAASQTDQIIWNPAEVAADSVYASLPARDLAALTATGRFGAPEPVIPAGEATIRSPDGTVIQTDAVYVPCAALDQIIGLPVPTTDPCHSTWVTLDDLNPHSPTAAVTLANADSPVATQIHTGTIHAPAELVGGNQSLLIPAEPATIGRLLDAAGDTTVHAVFTLHTADQIERLRDLLWQRPAPPLTGASGIQLATFAALTTPTHLLATRRNHTTETTTLTGI